MLTSAQLRAEKTAEMAAANPKNFPIFNLLLSIFSQCALFHLYGGVEMKGRLIIFKNQLKTGHLRPSIVTLTTFSTHESRFRIGLEK